jgi:hypothetical protein
MQKIKVAVVDVQSCQGCPFMFLSPFSGICKCGATESMRLISECTDGLSMHLPEWCPLPDKEAK